MNKPLYACIHAMEFPAQALLRLRPDLQSQPVVVLDGAAPQEFVCALNGQAKKHGAVLGMTRLEAEEVSALKVLTRSLESETTARAIFLECAAQFSPRIQDASNGTACAFVLDIAGTERLFGPPHILADRLRLALLSAGFRASIAVSSNYDAARMKAAASRGITVINEGEEANALARLPLSALDLSGDHHETFELWGIRTLSELASLPEIELVTRVGQEACRLRDLARGAADHSFQPVQAEFQLKEYIEFETHVEQMDSLLFIGAKMIDCLVARAAFRAMSLSSLTVRMHLEGELDYERVIRPAVPSTDQKFLLKLLQLEIAAHPPKTAVISLTLTAEAGQSCVMQLGLFAPQTPEPSRLDVTLARLKALVGDDRVGSPALEDTHRKGSFHLENFVVDSKSIAPKPELSRMALRRMRPPVPVRVALQAMRPVAFRDRDNSYKVTAAYGPWRSSGCWWSNNGWDSEEWDVLAVNGSGDAIACLLVLDLIQESWHLEALYD